MSRTSYETIAFEVRDNVAWITLNRPGAYNAIGLQSVQELHDIANRCGSDPTIRAAVLTGAGEKAFCAGGDVAAFAANPAEVDLLIRDMTTYLHMAIARLAWMDAPLIGMINGVAAGAGLSLVAACDLAIAADTARFTSAYTGIGLSPDGSSTWFLPRLVGRRRAAELYLTNRTLSAQEALDWGLVNQVVAADELRETVTALASRLPPRARPDARARRRQASAPDDHAGRPGIADGTRDARDRRAEPQPGWPGGRARLRRAAQARLPWRVT